MSTITKKQEAAIAEYLKNHDIPAGLGTAEAACSIAAINLALTGTLTDDIPKCMSLVIGKWIITVQDAMPPEMRNSAEYKALLPLAAGTGRNPNHEQARLALILDWMWGSVLPQVQPMADKAGFGAAWAVMCREKTRESAYDAARAADAAAHAARAARAAAHAARAAARAYVDAARAYVDAAANDAACAADAADAAEAYARHGHAVVEAAACAADAAEAVASLAGDIEAFWINVNPLKLLAALIAVA